MSKKSGVIKTSQDFIVNAALTTTAITAGSMLVTDDTWLPWQVSTGLLVTSAFMLLRRNTGPAYTPRQNSASFARSVTMTPGDWQRAELSTAFVYSAPILPCSVTEDEFGLFVRAACRRQSNWEDTNTVSVTGSRIKATAVLSAVYFTKHYRPRFRADTVTACKIILTDAGLLREWRQGHGGLLNLTRPAWVQDFTRRQWVARYGTAPPQKSGRFGGFFTR